MEERPLGLFYVYFRCKDARQSGTSAPGVEKQERAPISSDPSRFRRLFWNTLARAFLRILATLHIIAQVESRLTQLAGSVLRNAFDGQETSMMGLDVIWGEKESTLVWNSVKPLRKKRPPPPFPAASEIFSKPPPAPAPAPAAPSPVTVDVSAKGGPGISAENGVAAVNKAAAVASAAVSQAYVALASSSAMGGVSTSSIDEGASSMDNSSSSIGSVSGGSSSVSTAAVGREENVAVNSSEHIGKGELGEEAAAVTMGGSGHGSFVLLVLEGSLTAIYGDEAVEEARERVLEPGISLSSRAVKYSIGVRFEAVCEVYVGLPPLFSPPPT